MQKPQKLSWMWLSSGTTSDSAWMVSKIHSECIVHSIFHSNTKPEKSLNLGEKLHQFLKETATVQITVVVDVQLCDEAGNSQQLYH